MDNLDKAVSDITLKLNELYLNIGKKQEIIIKDSPVQSDLTNTEKFLNLLELLKIQVNNKFELIDKRIINNEDKTQQNTDDIEKLKKQALEFQSNINYLLEKLEELKKLIIIERKDDVTKINL